MSENKNEDTKTIWLNADFLNVLREVDRWDYLFTSTLEKVAEHFAKENNLKVNDSHHAHGVEFRQVGETHEVGFHLCTQQHLNDEALAAYESERDEEWNKLPEEQRKRIETREYLRSTDPWSIPEWNDYARIEQKGKRFRGAPISEMDLNPTEVYMIEADLRGIISSVNKTKTDATRRAFLGVDLTGAKIDYILYTYGRSNPDYYLANTVQYNEGPPTKKGNKSQRKRAFFTVIEMSSSCRRRLDGEEYSDYMKERYS